ncbi:hypothetical protein [Dokdonia sp. Asnod1-B02]|uniref:hypothetical protein n=1 Tax=Dokdonia sp. Asnod1-B02 TaxID=3160573 RepID=UPI00386B50A5
MLFIKFKIHDSVKYLDFQRLYDHMVKVRQPNFKFDEVGPEFDWDSMQTQEEIDIALIELNAFLDQQVQPELFRCKKLIPGYASTFIECYLKANNENFSSFNYQDILSIFNYLEFGFEVDLDSLQKENESLGIVRFSTNNYPFGGMERFLITLSAFNLQPIACFDGFNESEIKWPSQFTFNIVISNKTRYKSYIDKLIKKIFKSPL